MSQTLSASNAPTRVSTTSPSPATDSPQAHAPRRISSATLMGEGRAIEIEHGGRVYQLRITQLNKLILTA
ncbi:hemin uptake protein HemP [Pseudoduganella danionis]|uniref:hemin uptake protein HemP n=1 Tax=Pseudoduganella danionis TaxID=1890295 RepID=UPI0035B21FE9